MSWDGLMRMQIWMIVAGFCFCFGAFNSGAFAGKKSGEGAYTEGNEDQFPSGFTFQHLAFQNDTEADIFMRVEKYKITQQDDIGDGNKATTRVVWGTFFSDEGKKKIGPGESFYIFRDDLNLQKSDFQNIFEDKKPQLAICFEIETLWPVRHSIRFDRCCDLFGVEITKYSLRFEKDPSNS